MKNRSISNKKIIICFMIVVLILIFSNLIWFGLYMKEKTTLRHSIMPLSQGDYYQEQLALVKYYENSREYEYEAEEVVNYDYDENQIDKKTVPFIKQNPDYPTGCESVSAVMLLQSYGIDITVDEFVNKYLKKNVIYSQDGDRFGPDPKTTYAGDPTSVTKGFGIFEPGIKSAIENVLHDKVKDSMFYDVYGSKNKYPLEEYVQGNVPLVIWVTSNYEPVSEMWAWRSYNKKYTYTYPKNSHTIVVTGVDENYYYVNDPLQEEGNTKVEKKKLEDSFDSLGRQVIGMEIYDLSDVEYSAIIDNTMYVD